MNEYIESCQREKRTYDEEGVREAVRLFLKSIGEDPEREGLVVTPDRIARACRELFAGLQASPADVLEKHFDVDTEELVLVKDIELYSLYHKFTLNSSFFIYFTVFFYKFCFSTTSPCFL